MEGIDSILNKSLVDTDNVNVQNTERIRKSFDKLGIKFLPIADNSKYIQTLEDIYTEIFIKLSIPEVSEEGEYVFSQEIISVKEYYKDHLEMLIDLNKFLILYRNLYNSTHYSCEFLRNAIVKCILIYTQFSREEIYTDSGIVALANDGLNDLVIFANCTSLEGLMFGPNKNELKPEKSTGPTDIIIGGVIQKVFKELLHLYNKGNFKSRRSYISSLLWLLYNIKGEYMEEYVGQLLNFFLLMLDDDEIIHKTHALTALNEIVNRLMAREFFLYDRNYVIYNAISLQADSKEPEVLSQLYECLIKWAKYLDDTKLDEDIYCDELLEKLLSRMFLEQLLICRKVCVESLLYAIKTFGISAVCFCSSIKDVVSEYLKTFDGHDAETRLITLDVVVASLKEFWPVLNDDDIMELIQPVYHFCVTVSTDKEMNTEAKQVAMEKFRKIFELLNPEQTTLMKNELTRLSDDIPCFKSLVEVLPLR